MTAGPALAKIAHPHLSRVYSRKRLFKLLDTSRQRPVIWLSAPAGFGKTTLVADYLTACEIPCLWYQIDSGDMDIASFFYYLGLAVQHAAPEGHQPLPLLTPEYMTCLPVFTRNFFRDLFTRLGSPRAIVLDNYHEVTDNSPLQQLIAGALQEVPPGFNVIIISRRAPPALFARLQANRSLAMLNARELAFSLDETKGLAALFGYREPDPAAIEVLHRRFAGWCAGLILQLQQGIQTGDEGLDRQSTPAPVFDYLAIEVFSAMSHEEQDVLLKSAFLPQMSQAMLEPLTGNQHCDTILAALNRQNCFTTLYSRSPPVYQYHDLFREFLLKKGEQAFSAKQRQDLQKQAASLLLTDEKFEEAADLFESARAYEDITGLILKYAPLLVEQGRLQQLQGLIDKLPHATQALPWILYWQATALLPMDFHRSRQYYEQALNGFEQEQQLEGMFLSWAGIVDTIVMAWDDFQPLSQWIAWMDEQLAKQPAFPSPLIEARVVFGMFCSLMYHQPRHPAMPDWAQRVDALLENLPDDNRRIAIATHYILYLGWMGEFDKAGMVLERLRPAATAEKVQAINLIAWQQAGAMYHWLIADFEASDQFIQAGLDLAERSGIHLLDYILLVQRVYTLSDSSTPPERQRHLQNVRDIMDNSGFSRQSHYYYIAALDAALRRDPECARLHLDKARELMTGIGLPFPDALYNVAIIRILTELGRFAEAHAALAQAAATARQMKSSFLIFTTTLAEAELAFAQHDETAGADALTRALVLGKTRHYLHIDWWRPYAMLTLCLKALEYEIEVGYVQTLIRHRHLQPASPPLHLDNWPWQVKIYTLGRFSVLLDDTPIHLNAKGQKKPLELLKALIAFGGRDVSEARLSESLWPDAEGDVAHSAFTTTLSRLRKLLRHEALLMHDGQLSLNDRLCWLDTWAYQRLLAEVEHRIAKDPTAIEKIQHSMNKALALYKGPLLARQSQMSWVLGPREALRLRLLRVIKHLIGVYGRQGRCRQVIGLYDKALELDQVSEEYYRGLMKCHAVQGDRAKALAVYDSCKVFFNTTFKIEPSARTRQLYQAIQADDQTYLKQVCDDCRLGPTAN